MHRLLTWLDQPGKPGWIVFDACTGSPVAWLPVRRLAAWWSRRDDYPTDFGRPGAGW